MNDRAQGTDAYRREQRAASPGDERIEFPPHSGVWMVFARVLELIDANGVRREQARLIRPNCDAKPHDEHGLGPQARSHPHRRSRQASQHLLSLLRRHSAEKQESQIGDRGLRRTSPWR